MVPYLVDAPGDVSQGDRRAGDDPPTNPPPGWLCPANSSQIDRGGRRGTPGGPTRRRHQLGRRTVVPPLRFPSSRQSPPGRPGTRQRHGADGGDDEHRDLAQRVNPRKSTRMTLTTLRPWPSGGAAPPSFGDGGGCVPAASTKATTRTPTTAMGCGPTSGGADVARSGPAAGAAPARTTRWRASRWPTGSARDRVPLDDEEPRHGVARQRRTARPRSGDGSSPPPAPGR